MSLINDKNLETVLSGVKAYVDSNGVQSNWSQNNPVKADYVKNRTHWEENGVVHKLDKKYLPDDVAYIDLVESKLEFKADKTEVDAAFAEVNTSLAEVDTALAEVDTEFDNVYSEMKAAKDYVLLRDTNGGYEYIVQIQNGNLVSVCKATGIRLAAAPNKIDYIDGEIFDPTGMVVVVDRQDGSKTVLDNSLFSNVVVGQNGTIELSYTEAGQTFTISGTCIDLFVLGDFEYVAEADGTYTLTGWKETYNGVQSTELVVPDNSLINL